MTFHLAIPALDLDASKAFYVSLGASVGRAYKSHIVLNFFHCQLVIHQCSYSEIEVIPKLYPRHFGVIFGTKDELMSFWCDVLTKKIELYEPLFTRREGEREDHTTFFLLDPSNNVIEFKAYKNSEAIFG